MDLSNTRILDLGPWIPLEKSIVDLVEQIVQASGYTGSAKGRLVTGPWY
jgi:hypothetical protein